MKELVIDGLRISYLEENADKANTIVLIHGNSHSKNSFLSQLSDSKLNAFRLIALDLPGHGLSDLAAHYSLDLFSDVVAKLLNALNIKNALMVGHSLGGHVALQTSAKIPLAGMLLNGTPMLKKPVDFSIFLPNEKAAALTQENSTESEIENLLTELGYEGEATLQARNDFMRTDPAVRTKILHSVVGGEYQDEMNLLQNFTGKSLVLVSKNDKLINNEYILLALANSGANVDSESINAGHVPHVMNREEFNARLAAFADAVFANADQSVQLNRENSNGASLNL